jgi:hypothetical protein
MLSHKLSELPVVTIAKIRGPLELHVGDRLGTLCRRIETRSRRLTLNGDSLCTSGKTR